MKKLPIKIVLIIISITLLVFCLTVAFVNLQNQLNTINRYKGFLSNNISASDKELFTNVIKDCRMHIILHFVYCIPALILCIVLMFNDFQFLTSSLIKSIKEHRASTAEQRKAKKQAKLQAEIAEKQAELDEMKKDITE